MTHDSNHDTRPPARYRKGDRVRIVWNGKFRLGFVQRVYTHCLLVEALFDGWPHCVTVHHSEVEFVSVGREKRFDLPYTIVPNAEIRALLGEEIGDAFTRYLANTTCLTDVLRLFTIDSIEGDLPAEKAKELLKTFQDEHRGWARLWRIHGAEIRQQEKDAIKSWAVTRKNYELSKAVPPAETDEEDISITEIMAMLEKPPVRSSDDEKEHLLIVYLPRKENIGTALLREVITRKLPDLLDSTNWKMEWLEDLSPSIDLARDRYRLLVVGFDLPLDPAWRQTLLKPGLWQCIHMAPPPDLDEIAFEHLMSTLCHWLWEHLEKMGITDEENATLLERSERNPLSSGDDDIPF